MGECPRDEITDEATNGHPDSPNGIADYQLVINLYLEGEECTSDEPNEDIGNKRQQPTHRREDE